MLLHTIKVKNIKRLEIPAQGKGKGQFNEPDTLMCRYNRFSPKQNTCKIKSNKYNHRGLHNKPLLWGIF